MITLKLKYKSISGDITNHIREYNNVLRFAYNRLFDGMKKPSDIYHLVLNTMRLDFINSFQVQQCVLKASMILATQKDKTKPIVFGGKRNAILRSRGKITKGQIKEARMQPLWCSGSKIMKGNRYFKFDVIDNHRIIYKPDKHTCFYIELPKLRKCELEKLRRLQLLAESKTIPLTFSLSKTDICITYDETVFRDYNYQSMDNRVLSIDSNPNNTGWSVLEFDGTGDFKVLDSGIIDINVINQMNKDKRTNSSDPLKLKETRKRTFEIYELSKFMSEKAKHYRCCKFVVEELSIGTGDHQKGKNFNRLVNNKWNRTKWFNNLLKRCNIIGIEFVLVNPAYSSVIGNALYGITYPDPICAAIEIGRRGFFKFQKGMFYPVITKREELFGHLRKNGQTELNFSNCDDWKDVATQLKILKTSYRSSVGLFNLTVCSFRSTKSLVQMVRLSG